MAYVDYSGCTLGPGVPLPLWDAGTVGDSLLVQNQSNTPLEVLILMPGGEPPICVLLPGKGDWIDDNHIDPSVAVSVCCRAAGASFTAYRFTASS